MVNKISQAEPQQKVQFMLSREFGGNVQNQALANAQANAASSLAAYKAQTGGKFRRTYNKKRTNRRYHNKKTNRRYNKKRTNRRYK